MVGRHGRHGAACQEKGAWGGDEGEKIWRRVEELEFEGKRRGGGVEELSLRGRMCEGQEEAGDGVEDGGGG